VALIVLDAGVMIAHWDENDAHHHASRAALDDYFGHDVRMPASAYAEALVIPVRAGELEQARRHLDRLNVKGEELGRDTAELAALLRARNRALRLPDALVLACGELLHADAILTTDRRWRRYDRVWVI
jgi:predicted nucleic acid-binding protein